MTVFDGCLEAGVIICGVAVTLKRSIRKVRSVPELMASVDIRLANDLCRYAGDLDIQIAYDEALWKRLGGLPGIWHLLTQARLWLSIIIEIRKDDPDEFAQEAQLLRARVAALIFAALLCLFETAGRRFRPTLPRVNARVCVDVFLDIAAIAETAIVRFDSLRGCEVS